jgi:hypothetical protein
MTRQERVQVRCFDRGEVVEAVHPDGAVAAFGPWAAAARRQRTEGRKDRPMTISIDLRGADPRLRVGGRNASRTP